MSDIPKVFQAIPRLKELAEFRYQLRRFLSFSEFASERSGIQAQQYQLLQVVGSLPDDHAASITYIAERMILRHNSTVELVDRAERAGLVHRAVDERDLRRSLVRLTDHGDVILRHLVAEHLHELDAMGKDIISAFHIVSEASEGDVSTAEEH